MEREMAKVFSFIQMEVYMKAISVMDKEMVRASIMILSIRVIMKVNGLRERWMVRVIMNFRLLFFRENFKMILSKDSEFSISIQEINILGNLLMISFMGKENTVGQAELFILVILNKALDMIMENGFLRVKKLKFT